jgi:hypothetical protein
MNLRFYTFLDPHIIINTNINLCSNGKTMVICKLTKVIMGITSGCNFTWGKLETLNHSCGLVRGMNDCGDTF